MKMIGSIIRAYIRFCFNAAIFLMFLTAIVSCVASVFDSGKDYKRPVISSKQKTVKLIPYDDSKNTAWFKQSFNADEVLITYTCGLSDGVVTSFKSVESIVPQESYTSINNELNAESRTLDYDLCRDSEKTTVGLDDIYVRIVPQ